MFIELIGDKQKLQELSKSVNLRGPVLDYEKVHFQGRLDHRPHRGTRAQENLQR